MASVFGHGLLAFTITKVLSSKTNKTLVTLAILSAILPDIDVIGFGSIPYSHPLGHRGFTHSIVFALFWSSLIALIFGNTKKLLFFIVILLSTISHGILDAMTTGGRGVGFFIPFDNSRHFLSFRIIKVSPIGIQEFFSEWGWNVILSELQYIAIPCGIILITLFFIKKLNS